MSRFRCLSAAGIGVVVAAAPLAAVAVPISSSMSLTAKAVAGATVVTDSDSAAWGAPLSTLDVKVDAYASYAGGELTSNAFGEGSATWAVDGLSGVVSFTNVGWDIDAIGLEASAKTNLGGGDWIYTFTADSDGAFSIDYSVVGTGDLFGLWGWSIGWDGIGGDILSTLDAFDPNRSGSASRDLTAGETYTIRLQNNANLYGANGLSAAGSMNGTFSWRIEPTATPVSEPGSLALLLAAALALPALRRRTHAQR